MKLAPALVPLEAWFWYMLFLDLLSAKPCLRFLIELIENKGNNKITELRTILQRESQNS